GVFKAFRQALSKDEALFHRFQQFKLTAMRPLVEEWMAHLGEGARLARLGDEPEELAELVRSDIEIRTVAALDVPFDILSTIDRYFVSDDHDMPLVLRSTGCEMVRRLLAKVPERIYLCHAAFDATDPLAIGLYAMEPVSGIVRCSLHVLGSRQDSAALRLEWAVLEQIEEEARRAGASLLLADGPFLARCFIEEAPAHGFAQTGSVYWKSLN
ncbi:MAG: hypothetical protein N3A02_05625, partial [Rectinema sp.]|nr:hypothetical protein [Rectinema sp.]